MCSAWRERISPSRTAQWAGLSQRMRTRARTERQSKMETITQAEAKKLGPDTITRETLGNGLTVIVYPNPTTPALVARLSIKGGAMYDPPEKAGLASFAARAMR